MCKHSKTITTVADVEGFEKLKREDQERIQLCILKYDSSQYGEPNDAALASTSAANIASLLGGASDQRQPPANVGTALGNPPAPLGAAGGPAQRALTNLQQQQQQPQPQPNAAGDLSQLQQQQQQQFLTAAAQFMPMVDPAILAGCGLPAGLQQQWPLDPRMPANWFPQMGLTHVPPIAASTQHLGLGHLGLNGASGVGTSNNFVNINVNNNNVAGGVTNNRSFVDPLNAQASLSRASSVEVSGSQQQPNTNSPDDASPSVAEHFPDPSFSRAVDRWWSDAQWIKGADGPQSQEDDPAVSAPATVVVVSGPVVLLPTTATHATTATTPTSSSSSPPPPPPPSSSS